MHTKIIKKIKNSISYREFDEIDDNFLAIIIDRYRRHDIGGGEDGDDSLDDHEIDSDYEKGIENHKHKLEKIKKILKEEGYQDLAEFELGEKGHFYINITLKKV